eukprot:3539478-Amphidinium_carterae.1
MGTEQVVAGANLRVERRLQATRLVVDVTLKVGLIFSRSPIPAKAVSYHIPKLTKRPPDIIITSNSRSSQNQYCYILRRSCLDGSIEAKRHKRSRITST